MLANDIKKGNTGTLINGWEFRIEDNKKGLIRMATVYGYETEMGSIYMHDIAIVNMPNGNAEKIEFTVDQQKKINNIKMAGF